MALTLSESAKLSNDVLVAGVIETIIQESPVLQRLPFIEVVGNSLTYNRENRAPTASFYSVGDTWTESTPPSRRSPPRSRSWAATRTSTTSSRPRGRISRTWRPQWSS